MFENCGSELYNVDQIQCMKLEGEIYELKKSLAFAIMFIEHKVPVYEEQPKGIDKWRTQIK